MSLIMRFWVESLLVAPATAIRGQTESDTMLSLLQEAKAVISLYTEMKVIDTKTFEDQVHILVDEITHDLTDNFDNKMGELAREHHILMVSASSSDLSWPLESIPIVEDSEAFDEFEGNTLTARGYDYAKEKHIKAYREENCRGQWIADNILNAARCTPVLYKDSKSTQVYNGAGYSLRIAIYKDPYCRRGAKKRYFWQKGRSIVCYPFGTGSSMWLEWPNYEAP